MTAGRAQRLTEEITHGTCVGRRPQVIGDAAGTQVIRAHMIHDPSSTPGFSDMTMAPALRVREGFLIVMLSGSIDSPRARQLAAHLLRRIREERARIVVLDLTGVSELEAPAAEDLTETVEASRFMGAEMLVTGLSPQLAQTLAAANVDLKRVSVYGDLQGAIEYAERRLNRFVSATGMNRG